MLELTAVGIDCADHVIPPIRKKLALTLLTSGGRSVGIVRLQTKGHRVFYASSIIELMVHKTVHTKTKYS
jgi:hypothetical protein